MYRWKHMCIQMRRDQYLLKDSAKPKTFSKAHLMPHYFGERLIDTTAEQEDPGFGRILNINFGNKDHVYALLRDYSKIVGDTFDKLHADIKYVMWELEGYVDATLLPPDRRYILERKFDGAANSDIVEELQQKFGLVYNENYISTIWKHDICQKIAETAILEKKKWEARNTPSAWKICNKCGEKKLRDHMCFGKKSSSKDGYNPTCKQCLKDIRDKK